MAAMGDIVTAIAGAGIIPGTTSVLYGGEYKMQQAAPPRYIVVPTSEVFGNVDRGPSQVGAPRAVASRMVTCEIHVWGASTEATEDLINAWVASCQLVAYGQYFPRSGLWTSTDGEVLTQLGRLYVLTMDFSLPVTDPTSDEYAPISHVLEQTGLTNPGTGSTDYQTQLPVG